MSTVHREKYERVKEAAIAWKNKYDEAQTKIGLLQSDVDRWKKMAEQLPDPNLIAELETENRELNRTVRAQKKQISDIEEKYKDRVAQLEREKLLADGKIQQLEEAKQDLLERYKDLKQDYREQQRGQKITG
jgi:t-SNARE complex subunit (syntaxin)